MQTIICTIIKKKVIQVTFTGALTLVTGSGIEYQEQLTGAIDNLNTDFTTSFSYASGSTKVFLNGLKLRLGVDYTESGDKLITFDSAPSDTGFSDYIEIIYLKV